MTRSPLQQKIELVLLLLACESGLLPTRPLGFSCVCFSQCLPHLDSALTLSLSTWVVAVFFVFFSVSQQPQRFCLLVDSQVWEVDRLVYLNVLAGHVLPFGSLDACGLHLLSPTSVVLTKVRNIPSSSLLNVSPSAPSRKFGLHHWKRFLCLHQISNLNSFVTVHCDELSQLLHHL